jgi:hypothetical protein
MTLGEQADDPHPPRHTLDEVWPDGSDTSTPYGDPQLRRAVQSARQKGGHPAPPPPPPPSSLDDGSILDDRGCLQPTGTSPTRRSGCITVPLSQDLSRPSTDQRTHGTSAPTGTPCCGRPPLRPRPSLTERRITVNASSPASAAPAIPQPGGAPGAGVRPDLPEGPSGKRRPALSGGARLVPRRR